jgi:hypothetical protein
VDGVYNAFRGWYVDDITVRVTSGTAAYLFADDMEATTNWTGDGLWRQTGARGGADVSGTNRWVYNATRSTPTTTPAGDERSADLRWIDLTGATRATLSFRAGTGPKTPVPPGTASWLRDHGRRRLDQADANIGVDQRGRRRVTT